MVLDLANEMLKISGGSERTKEQYGINTGFSAVKVVWSQVNVGILSTRFKGC